MGEETAWAITGRTPLVGSHVVPGFKHAMVPLLSATLLADGPVVLSNVPAVTDLAVMGESLRHLGARLHYDTTRNRIEVETGQVVDRGLPDHLAGQVHGTMYLAPAMLARFGHVDLGPTGGCLIGDAPGGSRPTEHVVAVMERFGGRIDMRGGRIAAVADRLRSTTIDLADFAVRDCSGRLTGPLYSGATKTAILAAATAEGVTTILEPYPKPDVTTLTAALASAGVPVEHSAGKLLIEGAAGPISGFEQQMPPDVIDIVTFVAAAVVTGGRIALTNVHRGAVDGFAPELAALNAMGVDLAWSSEGLLAAAPDGPLGPLDIEVVSHGIFSDSQPFFAMMLLGASGVSTIVDTVWSTRFGYAEHLRRLGARLEVEQGRLIIEPSGELRGGTSLAGADLRGVAALAIAAAGAVGTTEVRGIGHVERGYHDLRGELTRLGASIRDVAVAQ